MNATTNAHPASLAARATGCPLCENAGGHTLWSNEQLRVIAVEDADYPGFTRVVWHDHVAEMTDLAPTAREHIMRAVYCVEQTQRMHLAVDKINLAAFGNMVPHLHWHIIPRWRTDRHFPDAYWAAPRAAADPHAAESRHARVAAYQAALVAALPEALA